MENNITQDQVDALYDKLSLLNKKRGYFFNYDEKYTRGILRGLLFNEKRYGYQSCPCRLATGVKSADLDIICPCDYRDADVVEFGACVCRLYVSQKVFENKEKIKSIPERRPKQEFPSKANQPLAEEINYIKKKTPPLANLSYPVWRCQVCG